MANDDAVEKEKDNEVYRETYVKNGITHVDIYYDDSKESNIGIDNPNASFGGPSGSSQQQDSWKDINTRFLQSFFVQFGFGLRATTPHDLPEKVLIKQLHDKIGRISSRLLNDAEAKYQMRLLYYKIEFADDYGGPTKKEGITTITVPEREWTLDPIWGNPGSLTGPNTTQSINFTMDDGQALLTLYFQKVPVLF
jgi:hypothetical protein